jgi:glucan phosphoethanolaminetransferase (alkaline phosphatase superfamily)
MTGIGIVISFLVFVAVVWYLSRKHLQSFWKFFYWLPILILLTYFLGSYTQFVFSTQQIIPLSWTDLLRILSPYNYNFNFAGVLVGIVIALFVFLKNIKTIENKKIWIDIFFYAFALAIVPLGVFFLMGDNFIGTSTTSFLGMKSLHSESQRNKFEI